MFNSVDVALDLYAKGVTPLPIRANTKNPATKWGQWKHKSPSTREIASHFDRPDVQVGAIGGVTSGNLVILDCDTPQSFDWLRVAMGNPDTWIVRSPRRGAHIYARTPIPVRSSRTVKDDLLVDIKAQGGYVLVPPSMFEDRPYQWIERPDNILELPSLDAIPGLTLEEYITRPQGIPHKAWAYLTGERLPPNDHSWSAREYSAVCSLVCVGWSYERIHTLFDSHASVIGHYKRKNGDERWLERAYRDALEFVQTHERPEIQTIRELRAWATGDIWGGRTKHYDQAVFLANLNIAERVGSLEYGASVRELADEASVSVKASSRAQHRIIRQERISITQANTASCSTRYRLVEQTSRTKVPQSILTNNVIDCGTFVLLAHDAFRARGLGKIGGKAWHLLLSSDGLTVKEIAGRVGSNPRTIHAKIEMMRSLGMVAPDDIRNGAVAWKAQANVNLDKIAEILGTKGAAVRQRARHESERRAHRVELERLRMSNSQDGQGDNLISS